MIWFATEKQKCKEEVHKHAGGKARDDVETILLNWGFKELPIITSCQEEGVMAGFLKKILYHFKIAKKMKNQIKRLAENDAMVTIHSLSKIAESLPHLVMRKYDF